MGLKFWLKINKSIYKKIKYKIDKIYKLLVQIFKISLLKYKFVLKKWIILSLNNKKDAITKSFKLIGKQLRMK